MVTLGVGRGDAMVRNYFGLLATPPVNKSHILAYRPTYLKDNWTFRNVSC